MTKITIIVKKSTLSAKSKSKTVILPYNGSIQDHSCYGIRLNYRMHTQCTNKKMKGGDYCKTCQKHADQNENDLPTYGDIRKRSTIGLLDYVDPTGKSTLPCYKVLKHLKITKEEMIAYAEKQNYIIPECHWEQCENEPTRGRPKKNTIIENEYDNERKCMMEKYLSSKNKTDDIEVRSFYHGGKIYLKSKLNGIWDIDTEHFVGMYEPGSNRIIKEIDILKEDENENEY
jgi:hypothetical protein